jgi:glucose-6-phosphate 1-dehydrogenase
MDVKMMDRVEGHLNIRWEGCLEEKPKSCGLVIFGASGDLTHRKLIPALFSLFQRDLLPDNFQTFLSERKV